MQKLGAKMDRRVGMPSAKRWKAAATCMSCLVALASLAAEPPSAPSRGEWGFLKDLTGLAGDGWTQGRGLKFRLEETDAGDMVVTAKSRAASAEGLSGGW